MFNLKFVLIFIIIAVVLGFLALNYVYPNKHAIIVSRPAVQAYEEFLDEIRSMAFFSDIEDRISPIFREKFKRKYYRSTGLVYAIKSQHKYIKYKYRDYYEPNDTEAGFGYEAVVHRHIDDKGQSDHPMIVESDYHAIYCDVGMKNQNGVWLLIRQDCEIYKD